MRRLLALVAVLTAALYFSTAYAQQTGSSIIIKGRVLAEDGKEGLANVSVSVSGRRRGVTTAADGTFSLSAEPGDKLSISCAGYETQVLAVSAGAESLSVLLKRDNRQLDDVIVTGYSTQNRKFVAGAITSVSGDAIRNTPAAGFNQLLQGKAAGVQVTANSGVPGAGITFRVRGNNSINASVDPLYIIDGVFVSSADPIQTSIGNQAPSNPLADINPSDIENITVLKDANATAIYGSLGANGVVLITTRRGRLNSKPRINLNAYRGWSEAIRKFKVTTGPQTGLLVNESTLNTAIDKGQSPTTVVLPFSNPDTLPTYDRFKDLFRTALTSNYEASAQGGTDKSTYYAGIGYFKQESVVKPTNYERFTVRLNYDNYISSRLKVGTSINISRSTRNLSSNDNNPQGVINSALFVRSYLPIYKADGTYARYGSFDNHIALIRNLNNSAVGWRTIGSIFGEYSFLPELKLRSSWSIDNNDDYENNYANTLISAGIATNGSASSNQVKNIVYLNEQVLTYIKSFGREHKHAVNALLGNTLNIVQNQVTSATGQGFPANSITSISAAATTSGSSSYSRSKLVSAFAKASYTYDNKYTIDGSIRADGSSRFGVNKRWAWFPSAGLTWRAGQETFIRQLDLFDELKIRASIGLAGNQNGISSYAALGLWSGGANYLNSPGTAPSQLKNEFLGWEPTRQVDIGTEFTILKRKLTVSFDYYDKYTYDLLLNVPVPYRSGFATYLQNYGAVSNKGIEVSLHAAIVDNNEWHWTSDFNISANRNKIEKLASDIAQGASGRNISILRKGYSVNSFWLYKQLYVDPQTGNAVYEDRDKSGTITAADRQIVGNALPKYSGGFNNNISYRNFDLGFFFYFQQGNKIMNMNEFFMVHGGTQANIGFVPRQLERWQKPGDHTDIPRLTTYSANIDQNGGAANNYGGNVASLSSRYLDNGSFLRLKTLTLGYALPDAVIRRIGISRARIYVQATNLFTVTKYRGLDPEVSSQSNNQNTAGYDWATVPQPRTIQAGLNVNF